MYMRTREPVFGGQPVERGLERAPLVRQRGAQIRLARHQLRGDAVFVGADAIARPRAPRRQKPLSALTTVGARMQLRAVVGRPLLGHS